MNWQPNIIIKNLPSFTAMEKNKIKREHKGKFIMILEDQNLRRRKKEGWVEKSQEHRIIFSFKLY